jgi:uncharacterized membrane protein (DUF4010 family)
MGKDEIFTRLAVALAIGLLIGLERGWHSREEHAGERAAGLRTHALSGLLGGIAAALTPLTGPATLGFAFFAFTGATAAFHWLEARAERDVSVTGVVAGMLAFMLGAYAVLGDLSAAVAGAVATTVLLALKDPLHGWLRRISEAEIRAVLILLAMSFLFLPVLPDRPVDPWGALNPASIWRLAILISGISFAGYVAIKVVGDQGGVALASALGGLTSSTATTVTLAGIASHNRESASLLTGGALLAGAVMVARVWLIAALINHALAPVLAWPLGTAAIVQLAAAALMLKGSGGSQRPALTLANPFELSMALKLAALIGVIMLAAKIVTATVGDRGLMALSALSGLADVDAITLSLSRMAPGEVTLAIAAAGIGLAVAVNTLTKAAIAWSVAGAGMGLRMAGVGLASIAAGAGAWWLWSDWTA